MPAKRTKPPLAKAPSKKAPKVDDKKADEFIQKSSIPDTHISVNTDNYVPIKSESVSKTKVTWMLPDDLLDEFEAFRVKVKSMMPKNVKGKITNSLLAEMALKMAIEDMKGRNTESRFYGYIDKQFSGLL